MDIKKSPNSYEHLTGYSVGVDYNNVWLYKDRNKIGKWYHFRGKLILENKNGIKIKAHVLLKTVHGLF